MQNETKLINGLHTLEIKSHVGDPFIDVILDGVRLGGVIGLQINAQANEIPMVTFSMTLMDVEVDLKDAMMEGQNADNRQDDAENVQ